MNPEAVKLLMQLHDEESLAAIEEYQERMAICVYDGLLSEREAEQIAMNELREKVGRKK